MQRHIALISHLSEVSGAGVALLETACALQSEYRISLILPGNGPLAARARKRGIEPIIIPNPESSLVGSSFAQKLKVAYARGRYVLRLKRFLKKEGVDLAYINSAISIFPGIAANWQGTPIVWHIHETLDAEHDQWRIRLISQWARGLLFASKSGAAPFSAAQSTPQLVVRNYTPVKAIGQQAESLRMTPPTETNTQPMFLMNGTFARKAPDITLHALASLRATHPALTPRLVIVGHLDPNAPYTTKLQEILHTHNLQEQVTFIGLQPSLIPLLAKTTLFISASRNEAMPIAIIEAMAAKVPVIATDTGDCAALLEHGQCGWVVPTESPTALAGALAEALQYPEEATQRANRAYNKLLNDYETPNFWQPLTDFLDAFMKNL